MDGKPETALRKCRCETERWITVNWEKGSYRLSNFVAYCDPGTCSDGCCDRLKCKLCGKKATIEWPD